MRGGTKWLSTMEKVKGNNQIPAQQQNFWRFFQKHLDKWLRPLGISEGALSGINFDANAEISVQKAASILMPQTKNGSISEPHILGDGKLAPNRSQKLVISRKTHKNRLFVLYPLRGEKIIFPFRTKKSAKNIEEENSEVGTTFDLSQ